jgi:hypothetical protein
MAGVLIMAAAASPTTAQVSESLILVLLNSGWPRQVNALAHRLFRDERGRRRIV